METIDITKVSDCKNYAKRISKELKPGKVFFFKGNLGSGKTAFTKFLLKALGFKTVAKSPSFTLVNLYQEKGLSICHMDLYRLKKDDDLETFLEYFDNENILIVEWPEILIEKKIKYDFLLSFSYDGKKRLLEVSKNG